mgnify:CR=1 FL=1
MNCNQIKALSISYIQSDIDDNQIIIIDDHLSNCSSCSQYFAYSKSVLAEVEQQKRTESDPYFFSKLMSKMDVQTTYKNPIPLRILKISTMAAAMLVAIIGGSMLGNIGAETINSNINVSQELNESILEIDLADNSFDIFKDLNNE